MSESAKLAETSFLSRWSRRKGEAAAEDSGIVPVERLPSALPTLSTGAAAGAKLPETPHPEPTLPEEPVVRRELPEIDSLTHEADFSPFMAREVDPGLRNRAMKKLFTDPHYQFGQMDKLDIYIDDYSQPDPIPLEMLRRMHQAQSLFLFADKEQAVLQPQDTPAGPAGVSPPPPFGVEAADATVAAPVPIVGAAAGTGQEPVAEYDAAQDVGLTGLPVAAKSA